MSGKSGAGGFVLLAGLLVVYALLSQQGFGWVLLSMAVFFFWGATTVSFKGGIGIIIMLAIAGMLVFLMHFVVALFWLALFIAFVSAAIGAEAMS